MYKTYSSIGSERLLSDENDETLVKKNDPSAQPQALLNAEDELIQQFKNQIPIHLRTLMLGVVYRFAPFQRGNFMPKWVEITEAGITYFRSATSEKAQSFFPANVISDVCIMPTPENINTLLNKIKRSDKAKREEETEMLGNMFEVVIDKDAFETYLRDEDIRQQEVILTARQEVQWTQGGVNRPVMQAVGFSHRKSLSAYQKQPNGMEKEIKGHKQHARETSENSGFFISDSPERLMNSQKLKSSLKTNPLYGTRSPHEMNSVEKGGHNAQ